MGLGKLTGSVTKGKSADLIILDRNLFQTPPDKLHETQVMRTYFQGKAVFSR
jgi:predicted amidohydrolase YtcJ